MCEILDRSGLKHRKVQQLCTAKARDCVDGFCIICPAIISAELDALAVSAAVNCYVSMSATRLASLKFDDIKNTHILWLVRKNNDAHLQRNIYFEYAHAESKTHNVIVGHGTKIT
ncbi:hypothetical protein EOL96_05350 [Candidatus Saccharibacteria bacterium]|nr:hypothetical protein [Candidatus Saccharibacteria bacterium]